MTEIAPPPQQPGQQLLSGYRIVEHLARGCVLDVYSVESAERGCLCIAKTLRPDHIGDAIAADRLLTEGRLMQQFSHPHLVRGYETRTDPAPTVIMETLTGQTLSHLVTSRARPLPTPDLAELGRQLCSAIGYLHHHRILHLDLKPSNIIASGGLARLIDLSHARAPGPCPTGFGTHEYAPPEQLRGEHVSPASDIYGLGGVLFRTATKKRPFTTTERDHQPDQPAQLTPLRRRRSLPPHLIELISSCLHPKPRQRPTLTEITDVLNHLADSSSQQHGHSSRSNGEPGPEQAGPEQAGPGQRDQRR